ncbi:MAG: hypothetical protein JXN59_10230, partial [Anaerolineae bacterium]|nr:hypothetical protein [Anaerolineae bacterium]
MASQRLYLVYRPQPSTNARIQRLSEQLEQDGHTLIAAPPDSPPDSPELREALAGVDAALLVLLDAEAYASLSRADVRIIREAGTRILCLTTLELATEQALASAAGITPVLLLNDDWDDLWDKLESRLSGPLSGQVPPPAPVEQPARSSGEDDSLLDHLRDFLDDFDVPAFLRRRTERKTPSVDVDISDPKAGPGAERGTWIPELDEVKRTRERPTTKVLESWDASAEDDETWAD